MPRPKNIQTTSQIVIEINKDFQEIIKMLNGKPSLIENLPNHLLLEIATKAKIIQKNSNLLNKKIYEQIEKNIKEIKKDDTREKPTIKIKVPRTH